MGRISRYMAIVLLLLGLVSVAMGAAYIYQGQTKAAFMKEAMQEEQITLGFSQEAIAQGQVVDSANEAQAAADTIREHRHSIAPTYSEALGGGRFDPTNPAHVTYAQAMNLENYLYLSVVGFGLTTVVTTSGAFMIVVGLALGGAGIAVFQLSRKTA